MRLDKYLIENNYFSSRNRAQNEIKNGNILIDDKPIKNPNFDYKNGVIKLLIPLNMFQEVALSLTAQLIPFR